MLTKAHPERRPFAKDRRITFDQVQRGSIAPDPPHICPALPEDVYRVILDFADGSTVRTCRLATRLLCLVATPRAFAHVRLHASLDLTHFARIAASDRLRPLVREITVDTWTLSYPSEEYPYRPTRSFFHALSHLRFFTGLQTLNLRFDQSCGDDKAPGYQGIELEQGHTFRYALLSTVFECLAGTWNPRQLEGFLKSDEIVRDPVDQDTGDLEAVDELFGRLDSTDWSSERIQLQCLTVSNLADFDDLALTRSRSFKQVMESKSLKELKLLVAFDEGDEVGAAIWLPHTHDFFADLPRNWLSAPVAQNLRVLSLFGLKQWGWFPRMDFRYVNPGTGRHVGLPNLKVLALGNYTFSHEWQVDWVASLGYQNGRGGLEELYLDRCKVLSHGRAVGPLDGSSTDCRSLDGEPFSISNAMYPRIDAAISAWKDRDVDSRLVDFASPPALRWGFILDYWCDHMPALRRFVMGRGVADKDMLELCARANYENPVLDSDIPRGEQESEEAEKHRVKLKRKYWLQRQPFLGRAAITYDCPSTSRDPLHDTGRSLEVSMWKEGFGMRRDRSDILLYQKFDWIDGDPEPYPELDEGAVQAAHGDDDEAYERIVRVTRERSLSAPRQVLA